MRHSLSVRVSQDSLGPGFVATAPRELTGAEVKARGAVEADPIRGNPGASCGAGDSLAVGTALHYTTRRRSVRSGTSAATPAYGQMGSPRGHTKAAGMTTVRRAGAAGVL